MAEFRIIFCIYPHEELLFVLRARARWLWLRLQAFPYFTHTLPLDTEIMPMFSISSIIYRACLGKV